MSLIRLWTIHPVAVWEFFQQTGELRGSTEGADTVLRHAYEWLRVQMKKRLPSYAGGWPVWAWVRWSPSSPKPDLRAAGHLERGTRGVRIELLVPENAILVSDFELWHVVLNNGYLSWSDQEDAAWERRAASGTAPAEELQREKETSWERIFDWQSKRRDPDWWGKREEASLQAVAEVFRLEYVQRADQFTAR